MGRVVYSTEKSRRCPRCGWPEKECRCSSSLTPPQQPVPEKITVRLRLENRSAGKSVTVIDGLPRNSTLLESLTRELKKSCGTGGRSGEESIELQEDQRERLRELLAKKGWVVKG